jgi:uncharacterized iron-regulated membrane protein
MGKGKGRSVVHGATGFASWWQRRPAHAPCGGARRQSLKGVSAGSTSKTALTYA